MNWLNRMFAPKGERKSYSLYQLLPRVGFSAKWSQYTTAQSLEAYKKSVWLYSCIRLRADNVATVPWVVETKQNGEWIPTENHPLSELLTRPNPEIDLPSMMRMAVYWLDLTGDAWGTLVRNGAGKIAQWWPLMPDSMEVIPGTDKLVESWKYRSSSKNLNIVASDIIHLKYAAPDSVYYGLSPLQAAAKAVDVDLEASNFQKVTLQNFGMPPGVFEGPADLTQEQYEQGVKWIDEQSGPERNRKPWILGGFKWSPMAETPHEMDFILSRNVTRTEICSVYAVPPPLVGIYDSAGGLNSEIIKTARRIFWLEGIIPVLRQIEGQLNAQLAYEYGADVRITYDLSNVEALEDDQGAKIDRADKLWRMGVPLAQVNALLELGLDTDEIEGADVGYLPSGLLPANFDTEENEPGGDDAAKITYGEGEPEPTAPAGPAPAEPVSNTALNGAQVTALQGIVQAVADGMLPAETALQLILVSFPAITEAQARAIMKPMASFEQAEPGVTNA